MRTVALGGQVKFAIALAILMRCSGGTWNHVTKGSDLHIDPLAPLSCCPEVFSGSRAALPCGTADSQPRWVALSVDQVCEVELQLQDATLYADCRTQFPSHCVDRTSQEECQ